MKQSRPNDKKKNTTNLAIPLASTNLSSILSSNTSHTNNDNQKANDSQTVVTTKTSATLQSVYAKANNQDVDKLFEDLLGTGNDDDNGGEKAAEGEDEDKSGTMSGFSGSFGLGAGLSLDNSSKSSILPFLTTPMVHHTQAGGVSGSNRNKKKGGIIEGGKDGGLMSVEDEVMQILGDTSETTATATTKNYTTADVAAPVSKTQMESNTTELNDADLDELCASTPNENGKKLKQKKKNSSSPLPWGAEYNDDGNNQDDMHKKTSPLHTNNTSLASGTKPIGEIFIYGEHKSNVGNGNNDLIRPSTASTNEPRHYRVAGSTTSAAKKANNAVVGGNNNTSSSALHRHERPRQRRGGGGGDESSVGSHGVSSILRSMGLGPEFSSNNNNTSKEGVNTKGKKIKDEVSEDGTQGKDKPVGTLSRQLAAVKSKTPVLDRYLRQRQSKALHLRAGVMIFGLVIVVYFFINAAAVMKHNRESLRNIKGRGGGTRLGGGSGGGKKKPSLSLLPRNKYTGGSHEEGVDRPNMNMDIIRKRAIGINGGNIRGSYERTPTDIQLKLVEGKVPTKRDGPITTDDTKTLLDGVIDEDEIFGRRKKRPYDEIDIDINEAVSPIQEQSSPVVVAEKVDNTLTKSYQYLTDVDDGSNMEGTALFWHIPRSGGTMVKDVLTKCRKAVLATDAGRWTDEGSAEELKVISINGDKYVNVDMSTTAGIERAKLLGLGSYEMADVIITAYIQQAASLFDSQHHGRAFTLIRNPVDRAVSMYNYLKNNGNAEVKKLTVEEYARSPHVENNWMVRFLTGKLAGPLGDDDLIVAKEVLKNKFVIGLVDDKSTSMKRFEQYFGWAYTQNPTEQYSCRKRAIEKDAKTGVLKGSESTEVSEGTDAYALLYWQNQLDMDLYIYAEQLFKKQGQELFPNLEGVQ